MRYGYPVLFGPFHPNATHFRGVRLQRRARISEQYRKLQNIPEWLPRDYASDLGDEFLGYLRKYLQPHCAAGMNTWDGQSRTEQEVARGFTMLPEEEWYNGPPLRPPHWLEFEKKAPPTTSLECVSDVEYCGYPGCFEATKSRCFYEGVTHFPTPLRGSGASAEPDWDYIAHVKANYGYKPWDHNPSKIRGSSPPRGSNAAKALPSTN